MLFKNIQDFVTNLPQGTPGSWLQAAGAGGGYDGATPRGKGGNGKRQDKIGLGSAPPTATFKEAWEIYCSANPRLRDPRALPALLRRCGPDETLRGEVWCQCLGIEPSSPVSAVASVSPRLPASVVPRLHSESGCGAEDAADAKTAPKAKSAETVNEASPTSANAEGDDDADAAADVLLSPQPNSPRTTPVNASTQEANATASNARGNGAAGLLIDVKAASEDEESGVAEEAPSPGAMVAGTQAAEKLVPHTPDEDLPAGLADLIEADVLRTFSTNAAFVDAGGHMSLRRVLRQFAVMDTELGYCQSLNFIAAIFLMVFNDERAALSGMRQLLVKLGIKSWYTDGMRQLRADTAVLEDLVRERLPQVHDMFNLHKFELMFVSSKWFLCLFATTLEGETLRRVWDVMLCDGIEAVIRVSFVLIVRRIDVVMKAKAIDDLIFAFQEAFADITPGSIISDAYDPSLIGQITKADLSQRRQAALKKVSSDDTRTEMRQQQLWRGGVRPASVLNRQ